MKQKKKEKKHKEDEGVNWKGMKDYSLYTRDAEDGTQAIAFMYPEEFRETSELNRILDGISSQSDEEIFSVMTQRDSHTARDVLYRSAGGYVFLRAYNVYGEPPMIVVFRKDDAIEWVRSSTPFQAVFDRVVRLIEEAGEI